MTSADASSAGERTERQLRLGLLSLLADLGRKNKWNVIGKPLQPGDLELRLATRFNETARAQCARAFEALQRADLIRADYGDTADPAGWVEITERGRQALATGALDSLDEALFAVEPRLIEMRAGIHDALVRDGPDSLRHACDSAWELISQVLKACVSDDAVKAATWFKPNRDGKQEVTRAHRARLLMEQRLGIFDEDACDALVAIGNRLGKLKHPRVTLDRGQVKLAVRQAEDALRSVLIAPPKQGVD